MIVPTISPNGFCGSSKISVLIFFLSLKSIILFAKTGFDIVTVEIGKSSSFSDFV